MKWHSLIYLLFFLLLIYLLSCTFSDYIVDEYPDDSRQSQSANYSNISRSPGLANALVGKSVTELVSILGQPDLMIDTVPRGARYSDDTCDYAYVYLPKPGSASQCVNTYVIDELSGEVIKFYCR